MSGPKVVTPPPIYYYSHDFETASSAEAAETMAVLGHVSGVSVTVRNGKINTSYSSETSWDYNSISRMIKEAKEQAQKNLAYVRQVRDASIRSLNETLKKEQESFNESLKNIDDAIARLEDLRNQTSKPLETRSKVFTCDKEVKDIEKQIKKLKKDRDDLIKDHESTVRKVGEYRSLLNQVQTTQQLHSAQQHRPDIVTLVNNPSQEVKEFTAEIAERVKNVKAYVDTVNQLYSFMDKENLSEFTLRMDDKVSGLDPYDPQSIKVLDKLIKEIIEERQFKLKDEENRNAAQEDKNKVVAQLETLRKISEGLRPLIFKLDEQNHEVVDVSEQNQKALDDIEQIINSIGDLDYISQQNHNILSNIRKQISLYKSIDLNKPRISVELSKLAEDASNLLKVVDEENQKYKEYQKALSEYLSMRTTLIGISDGVSDLLDLSKTLFNYKIADKLIADLKASTLEMKKVVNETAARAYISSFAAVIGQDSIFKKEEREDSIGFSYVRKETPGVIYQVEHTDRGALISPRGVLLSNGQPVIDEEGLRKVHSSCDWANDLNDRITSAGMPSCGMEEEPDEVREALYQLENYYHIESDEESIRYLKMCGYSDEEIKSIFHYDTHTMSQIEESEERRTRHEEEALHKDLDED